jgi:hypothetical protein
MILKKQHLTMARKISLRGKRRWEELVPGPRQKENIARA